jgi:chitinase
MTHNKPFLLHGTRLMKRPTLCLFIVCLLMAGCTPLDHPLAATQMAPALKTWRMVGYYPSWVASTRQYSPANVPADLLTHLNYAFVIPDWDGECAPDNAITAEDNIPGLQALKKAHPALQILISIGGGGDLEKRFKPVVESTDNLSRFVTSCLDLMAQWGFDGLDMDWEFTQPEYKQPFTALMSELRRQVDERGLKDGRSYLLTMAAPAGPWGMDRLELDKLQPLVDWVNLMTYGYYGTWSKSTGFNAPLYAPPDDPQGLSVDKTVWAYLDAGFPPSKLVLGVPFYGAGWQGVSEIKDGLFQPNEGIFNQGTYDYREIKEKYAGSFALHRGNYSLAPWLYNPAQGVLITFDDPQSLREKAAYARILELGGMMIWQLAGDDMQNSLLKALIE